MTQLYTVSFDRVQIIHKVIDQKKKIWESREELIRQTIHGLPHQVAMSYVTAVGPSVSITLDLPEKQTRYSEKRRVSVTPVSEIYKDRYFHDYEQQSPVTVAPKSRKPAEPAFADSSYADVINEMVKA